MTTHEIVSYLALIKSWVQVIFLVFFQVVLITLWSTLIYNRRHWRMIHLFECWQAWWWLVTSICQQNGRQSVNIWTNWDPHELAHFRTSRQLLASSYGRSLIKYEFGSGPNLPHIQYTSILVTRKTAIDDGVGRNGLIIYSELFSSKSWAFAWKKCSLKVFMSSHDLNGLLQQGLCLILGVIVLVWPLSPINKCFTSLFKRQEDLIPQCLQNTELENFSKPFSFLVVAQSIS